jgi:hypothetical protein
MSSKGRTYEVVEALIGGPPSSKPVLSQNGKLIPPDQLLIFNKNNDKMKKEDHYRVRFDIKQFSKSPLRFTPNRSDVLWVKAGAGPGNCPTSACHDLPETIWVDAMDPDGEWIDIINMDMAIMEFWFTLNLVAKSDPTSNNYVPVDPGGGNQNGGVASSRQSFSSLVTFALGVGAGILAYGGVQRLSAQ